MEVEYEVVVPVGPAGEELLKAGVVMLMGPTGLLEGNVVVLTVVGSAGVVSVRGQTVVDTGTTTVTVWG